MYLRILTLILFWSFSTSIVCSQNEESAIESLRSELLSKDFQEEDLEDIVVTGANTGRISKVRHTYFQQRHNGIPVYGAVASTHILPGGKLLKLNNQFIPGLTRVVPATIEPAVNAITAIELAVGELNQSISEPLVEISRSTNPDRKSVYSDGGLSDQNIQASLVYYPIDESTYRLAWSLILRIGIDEFGGNLFIDAENGNELDRISWINSCFNHQCSNDHMEKKELASHPEKTNSPQLLSGDTYNVYPMPIEAPFYGDRQIVMDPADLIASPFGWHDYDGITGADTTKTAGNNGRVKIAGNNYLADGGGSLNFDFPIDTVYQDSISESQDAITTNLFYWTNVCHDVWYQYGFDEASGNFQENNYGNGGAGSDGVNVGAQSSLWCNATFYTPIEGLNPIMSNYICGNRDGALDNGVVVHEYGHGISKRLTGGPSQDCLDNIEQMGEGWSDWFALMMTIDSSDSGTDARTAGNWLYGQSVNGLGSRPYPYSTDMNINPHTYDSIRTSGYPHGLGTVWCAMLWDMTWALIDQYGFDADFYYGTGGNNMAMALVIEGLKLQPCSPGFVDGRDAIIAADSALYGGANTCLIWEAFAKRGLGVGAEQGLSSNIYDGKESYYTSIYCVDPFVSFGAKGIDIEESGALQDSNDCRMYQEFQIPLYLSREASDTTIVKVVLDSSSTASQREVRIVDSILFFSYPVDTFVRIWIYDDAALEPNETIIFGLEILNQGSTNATIERDTLFCIRIVDDEIIFGDITLPCVIDADFETSADGFTTFYSGPVGFTRDTELGASFIYFNIPENGSDTIMYVSDDICYCDLNDVNLVSPLFDLNGYINPELTFDLYFLEGAYNGVVEYGDIQISTDSGSNYTLLKKFSGSINWRTDTISLAPYAGMSNVKIRFKYSDGGEWLYGMALDNIKVCEKAYNPPAIAVDSGSVDEQYIAPYTDNYFYDDSGKIIARIKNGSTDLGCTQVLIDRSGGSTNYLWDDTLGHKVLSKTYYIHPENNDPNAEYEVTFYLTQDEVIEWENTTGNLFVNAKILKNPLPVSTITPASPEPAGSGTIEIGVDTIGNTLFEPTAYFITSSFYSGFSGFAIGDPGSVPSNCPNNRAVSISPVPNGNYQAHVQLSSSGIIPAEGNVKFRAGQEILLLPNFEVKSGATFEATIDDCQDPP